MLLQKLAKKRTKKSNSKFFKTFEIFFSGYLWTSIFLWTNLILFIRASKLSQGDPLALKLWSMPHLILIAASKYQACIEKVFQQSTTRRVWSSFKMKLKNNNILKEASSKQAVKASFWGLLGLIPVNLNFLRTKILKLTF